MMLLFKWQSEYIFLAPSKGDQSGTSPNFSLKEDRTPKLQQRHYGLRLRPVEAQERRGLCLLSKRLPRVLADST